MKFLHDYLIISNTRVLCNVNIFLGIMKIIPYIYMYIQRQYVVKRNMNFLPLHLLLSQFFFFFIIHLPFLLDTSNLQLSVNYFETRAIEGNDRNILYCY